MTQVAEGSTVTLHFTLSLADGTPVDSTFEGEPMRVVIGRGELLDAVEQCLLGLATGERRRFNIPAGEAYGPAEEDSVYSIARAEFPIEMELEPGVVIGFESPNGQEVPGTVLAVDDDEVTIDFTHPLAGHDLTLEVEILAVEPHRPPPPAAA